MSATTCPLPPTSDLPFSLEALRAFNVEARRVLDAHGLAPLEARRYASTLHLGPTGAELRRLREGSGLTLRQVCQAAGVSRGCLQGIETGARVPAARREQIKAAVLALVQAQRPRPCWECAAPLPIDARTNTRYCSTRCISRAKRPTQRAYDAARGHAHAA